MANNSTGNPHALRKGPPITTTVPNYAKQDLRKRWWCSRPNFCASVTAKKDMSRHYRDRHPERLDANGKVTAAEMTTWVNEQYLDSGLATDEEIAAAAAANGVIDSEEEEDEEEDEEEEEIMEIDEDDDENDERENEDESENEEKDDDDDDEDMGVAEEEEDDNEEEDDEANDSEVTEGPTNPAYTSVQLLLRAANLRFAAWELLRDGLRVQAAAVEEEAVEWEAEGLVVRRLEKEGLRVPWDFGPAVEQAAMGGPGVMVKGEYGV